MYDDILVPTAGNEAIGDVLEHTEAIASGRDPTIHVLYVIDDQAFLTLEDEMTADVEATLRDEGERAVADVSETLQDGGFETTTALEVGRPADAIISYVTSNDIDIVTMGTRGAAASRNMLGSTAQQVVTEAPVPVVTVTISDR